MPAVAHKFISLYEVIRLLQRSDTSDFSLTQFRGADTKEVTFEDLINSTTDKAKFFYAIQSIFHWYRNVFTRGWTLQELLAPRIVEFFSRKLRKLGNKISLKLQIYKIISILYAALKGAPLSQFSINERLRWKEHRETKRDEDGAYLLLEIFGVDLAPIYSKGAAGAFRRLIDEIYKLERCIQDIYSTDLRDNKKRIKDTKGGLLKDSYYWVLNNISF
ncbi:hypothetical protein CC78DRAFT_604493 [Lojkania enalia]|uniref:Uncharacterized protein n=1 Tax=Lojkania enalia TaxID=147567 RepID=A0A9P4K8Y1_9PLEO|nr:hypothetical protein CC78DRAFT_604493 [Didymosphaeria enalia]